jgi:hypothetical protein
MQSVIAGVKENDLLQCVKAILHDRHRKEGTPGKSSTPTTKVKDGDPRTEATPPGLTDTPTLRDTKTPSTLRKESEHKVLRSCYREALFLTLVALGQDNIDLTAFDREYRRAFEKLPHKVLTATECCDKPPGMATLFCRKLFRDLEV